MTTIQAITIFPAVQVLRITGYPDADESLENSKFIERLRQSHAKNLILDMSAVLLLTQSTIGLVVQIAHLCANSGARLYLASLSPGAHQVLHKSCMTDLFTTTATVQEAIDQSVPRHHSVPVMNRGSNGCASPTNDRPLN